MKGSDQHIKVPLSLAEEIIERIDKSYDHSRTEKSRWHHAQILRLKLKELKDLL